MYKLKKVETVHVFLWRDSA